MYSRYFPFNYGPATYSSSGRYPVDGRTARYDPRRRSFSPYRPSSDSAQCDGVGNGSTPVNKGFAVYGRKSQVLVEMCKRRVLEFDAVEFFDGFMILGAVACDSTGFRIRKT